MGVQEAYRLMGVVRGNFIDIIIAVGKDRITKCYDSINTEIQHWCQALEN